MMMGESNRHRTSAVMTICREPQSAPQLKDSAALPEESYAVMWPDHSTGTMRLTLNAQSYG